MTSKFMETYDIAGEWTPTDAMQAATLEARSRGPGLVTIIEAKPLTINHWRVTVERDTDPMADFGAFVAPPIGGNR